MGRVVRILSSIEATVACCNGLTQNTGRSVAGMVFALDVALEFGGVGVDVAEIAGAVALRSLPSRRELTSANRNLCGEWRDTNRC